MNRVETKNGKAFIIDTPYWAGEHSFDYYGSITINQRGKFNELWAVDMYKRSGLGPLKHEVRTYVWAGSNSSSAIDQVIDIIKDDMKIVLTHIVPLDDRKREPIA
jgi:hypothetical protein